MKTKQFMPILKDFYKSPDLSSVTLSENISYTISKNLNKYSFVSSKTFSTSKLSLENEKIQSLQTCFEKLKKDNSIEKINNFKLRTSLDEGDQFPILKDFVKVFSDDEKVNIEHKEGQILFIDFWATWCGYCQQPMEKNKLILEKNSNNWGDKVKFIAVSLDDKKEEIIKRVNEKKWNNMEHLWTGGWLPEQSAIQTFEIQGIPLVVLIDQSGKIVFKGSPNSINLEEKINELLGSNNDKYLKSEQNKNIKKFLKDKFINMLNDQNSEENKFNLLLKWGKKKIYNSEMSKISSKYDEPTLQFDYNIKHEKLVKGLIENIVCVLNDNLKIVENISDPKNEILSCYNLLASELKEHNLDEAPLKFSSTYSFKMRNSKLNSINQRKIFYDSNAPIDQLSKVDSFKKHFISLFSKPENSKLQSLMQGFVINCQIDKGDKFISFQVDDPFSSEEKLSEFKHTDGEVLLVDFWATWCGPCQKPMEHNNELLKLNKEKWGDKVKIVGVSMDEDKEDLINRINEKKWNNVIHYILPSQDNPNRGNRIYGVKGIPCIFIINQEGKITYRGHPSTIDIQKEIDILLGFELEQKSENTNENKKNEFTKKEYFKVLKKYLSKKAEVELQNIQNNISYPLIFDLEIKKTISYKNNEILYHKPSLNYELRESDLDKLNPFLDNIYSLIPQEEFLITSKFIKTIDIEFGENCNSCSTELKNDQPQYYCKVCNLYWCSPCANKIDPTKKGNESLIHPHNLVYIHVNSIENLKNIDEYKFGKNTTFNENIQSFPACCNGCSGPVNNGYRWICISCRPGPMRNGGFVDLCNKCFEKLLTNDNQNILEALEEENHKHMEHLWLRIGFGGDYYNY